MRYPGNLDETVAAWLDGKGQTLRVGAAALRASYAGQGTSQGIDLAAYMAARLPAAFAANARVLAEVARLMPNFSPSSLRDVGAGPGTAGWAALKHWAEISHIEQVETSAAFRTLATKLNAESGIDALRDARVVSGDLRSPDRTPVDLVLASYVLVELPEREAVTAAANLWRETNGVLVLVEPGTPPGFARLKAVRKHLLALGASLVGPCTHDAPCPLIENDWCHFKVRLQRSRAHLHAKEARVPFEDEAFMWMAFARESVLRDVARIIAPPTQNKVGVTLKLCTDGRIQSTLVASRDKPQYKRARKLAWGDGYTPG